jgi:arabinose-5-phosphate isomerase
MDTTLIKLAKAVIHTEQQAIHALLERIDQSFIHACEIMLACQGRVIVTGMGKSGHIGGKIAATLASTGTPAFFVHPGEASHGDLGMITDRDVVLALSNSGETDEILTILPLIKRLNVPLLALTGNHQSTLAKTANVHLDVHVEKEACPLNLAPTASTTACLVMGDALAVSLLESRSFTADDFARSHPGGTLGRRLLLHVQDIMHTGEEIPQVTITASLSEVLMEMTQKGLGMTTVVHADQTLAGIFTDGDLRRVLQKPVDIHQTSIQSLLSPQCLTIHPDALAVEGLEKMQTHKINALPVTDTQQRLIGAFNMHDLLRARVI